MASAFSISFISIMFLDDTSLLMAWFQLVIRILPLLPGGMNWATTSGAGLSALSNTINHSSWIEDIHCRTDPTRSSTPEVYAAEVLDIPLIDIVILSWEEASTQKICEKLEQHMDMVFWVNNINTLTYQTFPLWTWDKSGSFRSLPSPRGVKSTSTSVYYQHKKSSQAYQVHLSAQ